MKDRLTLEDFKSKMKNENTNARLIENVEFIKGGAEDHCHCGFGKTAPDGTTVTIKPGL